MQNNTFPITFDKRITIGQWFGFLFAFLAFGGLAYLFLSFTSAEHNRLFVVLVGYGIGILFLILSIAIPLLSIGHLIRPDKLEIYPDKCVLTYRFGLKNKIYDLKNLGAAHLGNSGGYNQIFFFTKVVEYTAKKQGLDLKPNAATVDQAIGGFGNEKYVLQIINKIEEVREKSSNETDFSSMELETASKLIKKKRFFRMPLMLAALFGAYAFSNSKYLSPLIELFGNFSFGFIVFMLLVLLVVIGKYF